MANGAGFDRREEDISGLGTFGRVVASGATDVLMLAMFERAFGQPPEWDFSFHYLY